MNNIEELNQTSRLRGRLLSKIYKVWLVRRFLPVLVIEVVILSAVVYEISRVVFIRRVLENALNIPLRNPGGFISFFISAFAATHTSTKILTVLLIILVALLIRLITQGLLRLILVKKNYFGRSKV